MKLPGQAIAGHFNPMTGIGVRLAQAGHEVAWYTGSAYSKKLQELGIRHYPFDRAVEHTADNLSELYPERARLKGPAAIRFDGERILPAMCPIFRRTSGTSRARFRSTPL